MAYRAILKDMAILKELISNIPLLRMIYCTLYTVHLHFVALSIVIFSRSKFYDLCTLLEMYFFLSTQGAFFLEGGWCKMRNTHTHIRGLRFYYRSGERSEGGFADSRDVSPLLMT